MKSAYQSLGGFYTAYEQQALGSHESPMMNYSSMNVPNYSMNSYGTPTQGPSMRSYPAYSNDGMGPQNYYSPVNSNTVSYRSTTGNNSPYLYQNAMGFNSMSQNSSPASHVMNSNFAPNHQMRGMNAPISHPDSMFASHNYPYQM